MFRQDRTNPSTAVSNWKGRRDSKRGHPSTAVSTWLNGGLFGPGVANGFAYMAGGYVSESTQVQKWFLPIDTCEVLTTTLDRGGRYGGCPWANQGVKGYVASGVGVIGGAVGSTIWQIDMTNDSGSTNGTSLSAPATEAASSTNSGSFGYAYSVYDPATHIGVNKFVFSSDTRSHIGSMSVPRWYYGGISNSGVAGYPGGGNSDLSIDKFLFSNDTRTTLSGTLAAPQDSHPEGASDSGTAGYFGGAAWADDVTKVAWTSDTVSVLSAVLRTDLYGFCGWGDKGVACYWALGSGGGYWSSAEKMALPSETVSTTASVAHASNNRLYSNGIPNCAGMQP